MSVFDERSAAALPSPFRAGLFEGKVVLITGGGTGIGRATAREMASLGARIAICGRRPEPLQETEAELRAAGAEVFSGTCDIRQADQVHRFVDDVLGAFERIDVLINNAGGQFPQRSEALKPKGFDAVIRNNLVGTFIVTQAVAVKAMIPQRRGRIINVIANIARGFPGMSHTGAARAGVENLTKSLAVEWAPFNIQVTAMAPGTIVSSGTHRYDPSSMVKAREVTPAGRHGAPEEVSHCLCYMASDAADFMTGVTVYLDGGRSLFGDVYMPHDEPDPEMANVAPTPAASGA